MRVLSVRQPWAWLIVNGYKNIENREWPTRVRGRVLIHASKTMTRCEYEDCKEFMENALVWDAIDLPDLSDLQRGGIVGETTILDCVTWYDSSWFQGRYGFVLGESQPLPFVPCPGRLKFFEYEVPPGAG